MPSSYPPTPTVRLIKALRVDEFSKIGFKAKIASLKERGTQSVDSGWEQLDKASSSEIIDRLTAIYTRIFSIEDTQVLTQFYESPAGAKIMDAHVERARRGPSAVMIPPLLSPEETDAVNAFRQTPTSARYAANIKQANAEAGVMFLAWGEELRNNKIKQASMPFAAEADVLKKMSIGNQIRTENAIAPVSALSAGNAGDVFGQMKALNTENIKIIQTLAAAYNKSVAELGTNGMLSPQSLVSHTVIVENREKVRRMGELLDQYLQSLDDSHTIFKSQADAIRMPEAVRKIFEASLAKTYIGKIRFSETEKKLLALYDRTLDFADKLQGKMSIVDNKLMFSDPADLQIFKQLGAQYAYEAQQEAELTKESRERFQ